MLALDFGAVPGLACGGSGTATCSVRDVWGQKELGSFEAEYKARVASHGSAFLIVSAPTGTGLAKLRNNNVTKQGLLHFDGTPRPYLTAAVRRANRKHSGGASLAKHDDEDEHAAGSRAATRPHIVSILSE